MIAELFEKQRPLMVAGVVSMACGLIAGLLVFVDGTQILGIDRWIKPMKFFISIAIFVCTIAVYLYYLPGRERFGRIVSWGMIAIFVVEMTAVVGQALRGTTSHFNVKESFDAVVFAVMGLAIAVNTLLAIAVAYQYFTKPINLPPVVLWGMRLGIVLFLLSSFEGAYMSAQLGHAVGAADGGPGLPVTNWSTTAGDLRVAHFMGMHGLQALPVFGYLVDRWRIGGRLAVVFFAGLLYFAVFTFLFAQALAGKPLHAWS